MCSAVSAADAALFAATPLLLAAGAPSSPTCFAGRGPTFGGRLLVFSQLWRNAAAIPARLVNLLRYAAIRSWLCSLHHPACQQTGEGVTTRLHEDT